MLVKIVDFYSRLLRRRTPKDRLKYLHYSPKGKYLFTSTGKTWPYEKYGSVEARIWNAKTGELVAELKGHDHTITRAEFSEDEARVFTASDDHTARVWDAASGKEVQKFDLGAKIESIDVSPVPGGPIQDS